MIRLTVSVIGLDPSTSKESILARIESRNFDSSHAENQIELALNEARGTISSQHLSDLAAWKPEVSISLTTDEERLRPAFHLELKTLRDLAEAGASVDFDPYV